MATELCCADGFEVPKVERLPTPPPNLRAGIFLPGSFFLAYRPDERAEDCPDERAEDCSNDGSCVGMSFVDDLREGNLREGNFLEANLREGIFLLTSFRDGSLREDNFRVGSFGVVAFDVSDDEADDDDASFRACSLRD